MANEAQSHLDNLLPVKELQVEGVTQIAGVLNFTGASTEIDVDDLGRRRLNVAAGAGAGGIGGALVVATSTDLIAIDVGDLPDGTPCYVASFRDWFILSRNESAFENDPPLVFSASGGDIGDSWVRANTPDVFWALQGQWYVHPEGGDDENVGTSIEFPVATVAEVMRRIGPNLARANVGAIYVTIRGNVTEHVDIMLDLRQSVGGGTALVFTASLEDSVVASGTLSAVQAINEGTNTIATVTATGFSWAAHVNRVVQIVGGARDGARFVVEKDLGSNTAQITKPCAGPYDATPVTLQIGDAFEIYTPVEFGESVVVRGSGSVSFENLTVGTSSLEPGHAVTVYNATAFFDLCRCPNGLNAERASYVEATACSIQAGCRAQNHAEMLITNCHVSAATAVVRTGGTMWAYSSCFFGTVRVEPMATFKVDTNYHAGFFDCTVALRIEAGGQVDAHGELWGTGVAGPRVNILPGGRLYFDTGFAPSMTGSGAEISVGGSGGATTYAGLPSVNANNLALAVVAT